MIDKVFFETYCNVVGIKVSMANRIINGRYKPYLSALDDEYYHDANLFNAKKRALDSAIKKLGLKQVKKKLAAL